MSAALHLAGPGDAEKLLAMVAAYHAFEGIERSDDERAAAIAPLLEGSPHGAIWLIGPRAAPVGYLAVTFGWSIEMGGLDGFIDEFFIRESVRGRGMGTEVLSALIGELERGGLKALHLEVAPDNDRAARIYRRLGFRPRDGYRLMTWRSGGNR
ncbi:MAG: GNAT family N-acetyltransferase [Paracoccaceae bacterium]|nr:GNAT family N-acetyltransferase [Paracoccaceae bacterium]